MLVPILVAVFAASTVLAAVVDASSAVRAAAVVTFVMVAPGYALVRLLRLDDPLLEAAVGVAASIALAVVVSTVALYGDVWSPTAVLVALAVIAVGAAMAELVLAAADRDR